MAAAVNRRLALSRDQPVTDITSSMIRPGSFLFAFTYACAYLVVTSARDCIDNPLSMPHHAHRYAGIPTCGTNGVSRAVFVSLVALLHQRWMVLD